MRIYLCYLFPFWVLASVNEKIWRQWFLCHTCLYAMRSLKWKKKIDFSLFSPLMFLKPLRFLKIISKGQWLLLIHYSVFSWKNLILMISFSWDMLPNVKQLSKHYLPEFSKHSFTRTCKHYFAKLWQLLQFLKPQQLREQSKQICSGKKKRPILFNGTYSQKKILRIMAL